VLFVWYYLRLKKQLIEEDYQQVYTTLVEGTAVSFMF